jgi:putative transposase
VRQWSEKTEVRPHSLVTWLGIANGKYFAWVKRYGKANEHNGAVPRDHWLQASEREAIVKFHERFPLEGYRRLAFMMLDRNVVAVSPSSVYRVLRQAGLIDRHSPSQSLKGTGFVQPTRAHEHWHCDIAYLNISGTFYYLCSILDGYSRAIVHCEIREQMCESDVETILQRGREKFPGAKPRLISDNGPQFIARDFKSFVRLCGMTHVRTSPYYPQSNGKIERWHKTLKVTTIRPKRPASLEEARRIVKRFVEHYNTVRLHSAIDYVTPADKLAGKEVKILAARDGKLERARELRRQARRELRCAS